MSTCPLEARLIDVNHLRQFVCYMNTVPLISILAIEYFVLFYPPISHLIKHQYFSFGLMDHFLFVIKGGETYSFGYLPLEFIRVSHVWRKPVFEVCGQVRLKPAQLMRLARVLKFRL